MPKPSDARFLRRALELAERGEGHTRPNPPVGAVLVRNGRIVGEGWHRRAGGDHAEVAAIKDALKRLTGKRVARLGRLDDSAVRFFGASTLYVTLEPCSSPGRVGACTDAIVAAGIGRVVYAVEDPNPKNAGRARRILSKAGVSCRRAGKSACDSAAGSSDDGPGDVLAAAKRLIAPFSKHVKTGLPYVTVKLALSLDGRICDDRGGARWISSAAARKATGAMRERVDVIMVGAETVRRDDPSLLSHGRRNDDLVRVVVTRSGRLPKKAQVLTDGKNPTLVYRTNGPLREILADLGRRGFAHVLCEGGLGLATGLAEEGLVDEWVAVLAPCVIGHRPVASKISLTPLGSPERLANDVLLRYRT